MVSYILFGIIYLAGLVSAAAWAVFAWTKYRKKHHVSEFVENILGFVLFVVTFFGGFMVMNMAKNETIEDYKKTQTNYCVSSNLTNDQCQYFQDVLNGKYSNHDTDEEYEWLDRDPY